MRGGCAHRWPATLLLAASALVGACAQWPMAATPTSRGSDAGVPALPDEQLTSVPLDPSLFGSPPSLRRGDGVWLVGVTDMPHLVFRRTIPSEVEPVLIGVANPWLADAPPPSGAAFAYAVAPLVRTVDGWARGSLSAEVYVTEP